MIGKETEDAWPVSWRKQERYAMEGLIILMAAFGLAGMGCVAYGGYQLWFTNRLQRKGMALEGTIVHRVTRSAWIP